ncbi:hypothetical protein BDK51DRAFT_36692 [Blyttiomyces helicus]|uniref:Uncharacterized protein n=1 Tax=Blyttiomyces helicus TaxID=388810 RepID=A0A4P9WE54_9FUNG|nr:hypothetical protein BDK51DRAFT_36692 [Blyttiomyces helicus]|eukprot:RKO89528.1 hypothetical protein BDK51DRAFT_36692 [Blyttiomyces helicus]
MGWPAVSPVSNSFQPYDGLQARTEKRERNHKRLAATEGVHAPLKRPHLASLSRSHDGQHRSPPSPDVGIALAQREEELANDIVDYQVALRQGEQSSDHGRARRIHAEDQGMESLCDDIYEVERRSDQPGRMRKDDGTGGREEDGGHGNEPLVPPATVTSFPVDTETPLTASTPPPPIDSTEMQPSSSIARESPGSKGLPRPWRVESQPDLRLATDTKVHPLLGRRRQRPTIEGFRVAFLLTGKRQAGYSSSALVTYSTLHAPDGIQDMATVKNAGRDLVASLSAGAIFNLQEDFNILLNLLDWKELGQDMLVARSANDEPLHWASASGIGSNGEEASKERPREVRMDAQGQTRFPDFDEP